MITDHVIARWRLRSQHLVRPHAETALDAVGNLLAVGPQEYLVGSARLQ